jgi:hypothetical protein
MTTQPSFINIEYVGSPLMESTMWTPVLQTEHKKGGIGSILGIVASIAVPFFAPMIATAVFGGASVLGSALTGAALGAGTSALTGGNPLTGALMGGIGAGFSSYMSGNPFGFGNAPVPDAGGLAAVQNYTAAGSPLPPTNPYLSTTGADLAATGAVPASSTYGGMVYDPTSGQMLATTNPGTFNIPDGGLSTVGTTGSGGLTVGSPDLAVTSGFTGAAPAGVNPIQLPPLTNTGGLTPFIPGVNGIDPGTNFLGMGGVPSDIAKFVVDGRGNTFLNPAWQQAALKATASSGGFTDALIRGGVNLAGMAVSQLAPNPQQQIADKYAKELAELKKTDQAAYEVKKKEVEGLIASAKAMDPAYFAQQAANAAKISGTRGLMESFREAPLIGLRSPEFISAEGRRASIGIGQNVGTAYDQGFGTGLTARQSALSSAINQMPNSPSRYLEGLRSMAGMQDNANRYGSQSAQGYSNMFGTLARPFMTSQV